MNKIKQMLNLYFVAGSQDCRHLAGDPAQNLLKILQQALQAGITCFQFRDKGEHSLAPNPDAQKMLAKQCLALCQQYDVPFIVNDDVQLAIDIGANGIHVGQQDMAIREVLARTKRKLIVGLSTNNLEEVQAAEQQPEIDYIGVGPIFATGSKSDHSTPLGIDFVAQLKALAIQKPFVVIGGIDQHSAKKLRALGADGVAVISAITKAGDVKSAVRNLLDFRSME